MRSENLKAVGVAAFVRVEQNVKLAAPTFADGDLHRAINARALRQFRVYGFGDHRVASIANPMPQPISVTMENQARIFA